MALNGHIGKFGGSWARPQLELFGNPGSRLQFQPYNAIDFETSDYCDSEELTRKVHCTGKIFDGNIKKTKFLS